MRRKGGLAVMLAAAIAAAAPAVSYGAVSVYDSLYSYDRYDSGEYADDEDDSYDSRSRSAQDVMNGPGVVMDEDEARTSGPTVKKVTLSEQYHEEYKTYEESMADVFFLYTNVANGGITDQPVTIDIPANLTYTMEKDGAAWAYAAGQTLTERGTYVLKLSGVENPELPLSRQTEYEAVFRFRIQEKPPAESSGSDIPGTVGVNEKGETVIWGSIPEWTTSESLRAGSGNASAGTSSGAQASGTSASGDASENAASGNTGSESAASGNEASKSAAEQQAGEAAGEESNEQPGGAEDGQTETGQAEGEAAGEESAEGEVPSEAAAAAERTQVYNPSRRVYLVTLENGKDLVSNVPEGYIGSATVQVTVAEEDAETAVLYRGDEPVEYVRGEVVTEPGSYRLVLDGCAYTFAVASRTGTLDIYPAPAGTHFTAASLDGESISLESDRYVQMEQDGTYVLSMAGEAGDTLEVTLVKDTQAPEFEVTLQGGTASIQYLSDDIDKIVLERNGDPVEGFSGYTVSSPGTYRLIVTDAAGNEASAEFALSYHVNAYGIAAVILVILVIAGAIAFVIHTKKTIKIR